MFESRTAHQESEVHSARCVAPKPAVVLQRLWVTGDTYHPLYNVAMSSVTP